MQPILTIAICTYNRADFLKICLDAVHPLVTDKAELLIVDNGTQTVKDVCSAFSDVNYVREDKTGLSFARNRAIKESKGTYILYLDDDATVEENFVDVALRCCSHGYDVFGGNYRPWYFYGKPKWYKDHYAAWSLPLKQDTLLPNSEFLHGGIMAYRLDVFKKAGTFRTDIGMIGMKVGYGEETELQHRLRESGYSMYYIPDLRMDHLVAQYKLDINWFLQAAKDLGRDMAKYHIGNKLATIVKEAVVLAGLGTISAVPATVKLIFQKDYFIENWKMDVLKKAYKRWGFIQYLLKN